MICALAALWWAVLRLPSTTDLVRALPPGDEPTLYVDVSALRQVGLLDRIAGQAGAEEPEYKKFVAASGFDYRRDLDAVLIRFRAGDRLLMLEGRFEAARLDAYARAAGGRCAGDLCSVEGSERGRQISWVPFQRGRVLALAVSPDPMAAALLNGAPTTVPFEVPRSPVWLMLPGRALHAGAGLPPGASVLLSALEGAERATFSAAPAGADLRIHLAAPCANARQAAEIADRLTRTTELFKRLLARDNRKPDPRDLSGILAGGQFGVDRTSVSGNWTVSRAFLNGLAE